MKLKVQKDKVLSYEDELTDALKELDDVMFDLDQPEWMAGKYWMTKWNNEKLRLKAKINRLTRLIENS